MKTYYAWSRDATLAEYLETDSNPGVLSWTKSYVFLGARLLATLQPNGTNDGELTQFHHPDRLGTRLITNSWDTSVQEQVTLPFGTALNAESTGASNRRFTSYDRSISTGLDYAVNRHYDSQQGRFTQVDPIGMGASSLDNPQTLNMYAYCGNDPINRIDPDGLFWGKLFRWIGKIIRAIAAVVAVAVALIAIGAATWGFGAAVAAKLAFTSGMLFAYAFGPPKVRMIVGALAGFGAISGSVPMIYSFAAEAGGVASGLATAARIFAGTLAVGSVTTYFQKDSQKSSKSDKNRQKFCERLAQRISNLERDLTEKISDLEADQFQFFYTNPAEVIKHMAMIGRSYANIQRRRQEYRDKCGGDPPAVPPSRPPVIVPKYRYPKPTFRVPVPTFPIPILTPTIPVMPAIPICYILGTCEKGPPA